MDASAQPFLRIVGGQLTDWELAALTAVLLARVKAPAHARGSDSRRHRPLVHWPRRRRLAGYHSPVSWR
ncbi:MAG: acyl-CoA carboxylase epsilon subunit [Mycobacteriales bacterium]